MRVALLCDVDQTVYHVGDEAIGIASAEQLRKRGLDVVMVSRREKYGPSGLPGTDTIRALTFPWPEEDRRRYLGEIRSVLDGDMAALPPDDKLFGIIEQLRTVDALIIGGGGSLNSRFGWLLDERLATALVVSSMGKPVILTGQSLGPSLSVEDRHALAELLSLCALVGVRDHDSYLMASKLCPGHPALFQTLDDAVSLDVDWDVPKKNRISVTLGDDPHPFGNMAYAGVLAALADGLADRTGAEIEFVPHMADPDEPGSDVRMHALVSSRLVHPSMQRPIEHARQAAARLAASSWVLTTRFHPVLFGLLSGASVMAIGLGRYGLSRMDGALRNWGWDHGVVPFASLWNPMTGGASNACRDVLDAVVATAQPERAFLISRREERLQAGERWWDHVAAVLTTGASPAAPVPEPCPTVPRFGASVARVLEPMAPWAPETPGRAVAIIMRTRDRADLLDRAVQDVLDQTFGDWQLVVVDDGGDATAVDEVLALYRDQIGSRLSVIHNPVSHGMEAASNIGLANSSSEFVVIHDDDDTWHPNFLCRTVAHLRSHPEEEAVATRTMIIHERQLGHDYVEYARIPVWPTMHAIRLVDFMALNRIVPICLLYRRKVHEQIGLFDEQLPAVGDYSFHLRLLQGHHVGFLEEPLAHWHLRPAESGSDPSGNSFISRSRDHDRYDLALRDQYFQKWVEDNGLGLPLFIGRMVQSGTDEVTSLDRTILERLDEQSRRLDELGARIGRLEEQLRDTDHAVRTGGGFNYAKRTYIRVRGAAHRAASSLRQGRQE